MNKKIFRKLILSLKQMNLLIAKLQNKILMSTKDENLNMTERTCRRIPKKLTQ